jgi:hypothetical protein
LIYQLTILLLAVVAARGAPAVIPRSQSVVSRSVSGQFVVHGEAGKVPMPGLATNQALIRLEPSLLTVSSERLKQQVWKELELTSPWQGKIHLTLYPATTAADPIGIRSERFNDGWQYWVALPDFVDRARFVRALTHVVLLELANREANTRSAELPPWLVEGFTRELLSSSALRIILPPPQMSVNGLMINPTLVAGRRDHPLERAHRVLCQGQALSFDQLSWPREDHLSGELSEVFQACAQLFVHDLLKMEGGKACFKKMLADLPRFLNWQFAFLGAYQQHFRRPLDVEKWWALRVTHFTGRDLEETFGPDESWAKLGQAVRSSVQVRTSTNDMPLQSDIQLQRIIQEWDPSTQTAVILTRIHELKMLQLRLHKDFVPVADGYCQVLTQYLEGRNKSGFLHAIRKQAALRRLREETMRELNSLDARRERMRPEPKPDLPVQAQIPSPIL